MLIGLILFLKATVFSQPYDIEITMNSKGHLCIYWVSTIPDNGYIVYGRLDSLTDVASLPKEGKTVKAQGKDKVHDVELTSLVSNKMYIYQVGSDVSGWSPIYSFIGPVQSEEHYPNLAVLGEITNSTQSFTVLSQLISRSLIERLDGIIVFGTLHDHPLYDAVQSNIPTMYVPFLPHDSFYSVKYCNTYLIFINTALLDDLQLKWLKSELETAQKYYWIIVIGESSLHHINTHFNYTQLFMDYHTNMYIYHGEYYSTIGINYPLDGHLHLHYQETSELFIIEQGPSWVDNLVSLKNNNSIFSASGPGYGILTPKYASFIWQEFSSITHRLVHEIVEYRIDSSPRKDDEIKSFKIIFVIIFLIFLTAFVQNYVQKQLEKRKVAMLKPLEKGTIELN